VPPQSTSVSLPFFTMSEQVGIWQVGGFPLQTPLWQSPAPAQRLPFRHFGQSDPQSTSVSVWFKTPSEQVAVRHRLPVQTPLLQSTPPWHERLVSQRGQVRLAPPQSMSVSSPLRTTSEHVGIWQRDPAHTPLVQSVALPQAWPARHVAPQTPPQSMSDSVRLSTPSEHVAI
jgi:hypothetical protein